MENQNNANVIEQFKKLPPAEKFEVILRSIQALDMAFTDVSTKTQMATDSLVLLYKQFKALLLLLNIDEKQLGAVVEQMEAEELKSKVEALKEKGLLKESDTNTVTDKSFLVLRIIKNGEVYTNRAQAPVSMMAQELKEALIGKSRGDAVTLDDLQYEILEIYEIKEETAQQSE